MTTVSRVATLLIGLSVAGCVSGPPPATTPEIPAPPPVNFDAIPDAVPKAEPRSPRGNPPFYDVFGKRYYVLPSGDGYVERGVASWYGPGFHKGKTAMGEPYDMYGMTAAHKTLPLPAYVLVTNLKNGKSVTVRVNDRGPFKDGRIIDLSRTAASKLDMLHDGTTFVEVRTLTAGNATTAEPLKVQQFFVQAGAFAEQSNADALAARLRAQGHPQTFVRNDVVNGKTLYRVRIGPVSAVDEFDRVIAQLKASGVRDAQLAND